ncbi:MAG: hypothetical protein ACW7DX_17570 [Paraglaciecola chathamensis]
MTSQDTINANIVEVPSGDLHIAQASQRREEESIQKNRHMRSIELELSEESISQSH